MLEKHLAGRHNQDDHTTKVRAALQKMPTGWTQAKKLKDLVSLELGNLSKSSKLSKGLRWEMKALVEEMNTSDAYTNLATLRPLMKRAWELSKAAGAEMHASKLGEKPVVTPKPAETLTKPPVDVNAPPPPGENKPPPVPAATSPTAAKGAVVTPPAKVAEYNKKANTFMDVLGSIIKTALPVLAEMGMALFKMGAKKPEVLAPGQEAFNTWDQHQAKVIRVNSELTKEGQNRTNSGLRTMRWYQLAKEARNEQELANQAKGLFMKIVGDVIQ